MVPQGCLQFVIVVFPDHTHLLFLTTFNPHMTPAKPIHLVIIVLFLKDD